MGSGSSFEDLMANLASFGLNGDTNEIDTEAVDIDDSTDEIEVESPSVGGSLSDPFASFFDNSSYDNDEDIEDEQVVEVEELPTLPSLPSVEEVDMQASVHEEDIKGSNDSDDFDSFLNEFQVESNVEDDDSSVEEFISDEDSQDEEGSFESKAVKNPDESASTTAVTPNGHTLEDMLRHRRGGKVKIDKEIEEYKSGVRQVIANGTVKEDALNVKHVLDAEEENRKDEGRIKASKSFIQRNSRYTEEEKLLMRRLGITHVEFKEMMKPESGLTNADKERIIALGGKGNDRYFKGKRIRPTVADRDIIQFLAKFKFASARILSRLRDEPISRTWRKLQRLKKGGLVADSEVIGMGTIWYLSTAGMALSGYSFQPYRRRSGKTSQMPPTIGANHVAACLWNNTINILCEENFPQKNRLIPVRGDLDRVVGEELVSELELRSSLGREANPAFGGVRSGNDGGQYAMVAEQAQAIWHEWDRNGRSQESPETQIGNEYLWVLYPTSGFTKSFHIPDLVVKRPRDADGTPRSIAVEIELNQKSYDRYMETLMAYKIDNHIYEKVVWVTTSSSIARVLTEIADKIGLEGFDVVPMVNEDGEYRNPDIWYI